MEQDQQKPAKSNTRLIKKSTKLAITALAGIINLGKYALATKLVFTTRLLLHSVNAEEKKSREASPQIQIGDKAH